MAHDIGERVVVRQDMELPGLQVMLKVRHSFIYCQELPVKRYIFLPSEVQAFAEKAIGGKMQSVSCCSTASTVLDEASMVSMVAAFGTGVQARSHLPGSS